MLVDLHAKSSTCDGVTVTAEALLRRAKEKKLDAVLFTETSRTSNAADLVKLGESIGIKVFVGIEIATDLGFLICVPPEIDNFLIEEEWRQATELTTPAADYVIEMLEEIGGAVIASRPYDLEIPHNMGDWVFRINGIDAIEVFNPRVGRIQSDFAQEAAQSLSLPTTGGSDPTTSLDDVGMYATYFFDDFTTQAQFVAALKGNAYWSLLIGEVSQERSSRTPSMERKPREKESGRRASNGRGQRRGRRGNTEHRRNPRRK